MSIVPDEIAACTVCSGGSEEQIVICTECGDPAEVRTYCLKCGERLTMTVPQAHRLMLAGGYPKENLLHAPGFVIRFEEGCDSCHSESEGYRFRLFYINQVHHN